MVEQRTENPCVPGSIPGGTTLFKDSGVCSMRRDVNPSRGAIAQLVEQRTENPCVPGSIPGGTTSSLRLRRLFWRDGRVVDYSSLENYRTERYRGFESLSLRKEVL